MATKPGSANQGRKAAAGPTSSPASRVKAAAPKAPASKGTSADTGERATLTDADVDTEKHEAPPGAPERKPWPIRLYLGEIGYDFIGKRKFWYGVSAVIILICLASMIFRQFNLGVEFAGGERFRTPGAEQQLDEVTQAVEDLGAQVTSAQAVGDNQLVIITADLTEEQGSEVTKAIADSVGVNATDVTNSTTSASWGRDVTSKAVQGLLVFLVLVLVFLAVRFQWKMAAAAMVALVHDLLITAGVYSLVGFEVTPASVIGLLTILGFSLYDTVVVFDKIDENTKGLLASQRRTYSEAANLAVNQVLMRSINTSIFALLPVLGLLYAGVFLIGEGTLQDLALVLFVGMLAGVYSSIFLAAPVLCDLKEREPEYQKLAQRLNARRAGTSVDKRAARRTPIGNAATAPAAAADDETSDDETIDDETADPDIEDADDAVAAHGGGAALVASARRTRPRSSRTAAGTTKAGATKTSATNGDTAKGGTTSRTGESAGSRLAPRPGAKPARGARTRGGSAKRNR